MVTWCESRQHTAAKLLPLAPFSAPVIVKFDNTTFTDVALVDVPAPAPAIPAMATVSDDPVEAVSVMADDTAHNSTLSYDALPPSIVVPTIPAASTVVADSDARDDEIEIETAFAVRLLEVDAIPKIAVVTDEDAVTVTTEFRHDTSNEPIVARVAR
jgi:hypothetical protein